MGSGAGRISLIGVLLVAAIAVAIMLACMSLSPARGAWYGAGVLIAYALLIRWRVTGDHRVALWHLANHDYAQAIGRFEASLAFFDRHPLLDRLRYVLLVSPTGHRYREMAMLGLGYCHAQLGHVAARDWYEACLRDYPKNMTAMAALALMRTGARIAVRGGRIDGDGS
ncbi:MAG TPA: hypothetical protein VLA56_00535 [Pseudomonadales bacterium]|nr:hypothetical protein [Pseudomonadales bacterium]